MMRSIPSQFCLLMLAALGALMGARSGPMRRADPIV